MTKKLVSFLLLFLFLAGPVFAAVQPAGPAVQVDVINQQPSNYMQTTALCASQGTVDNAQCYGKFQFHTLINVLIEEITGNIYRADQNSNNSGGLTGSLTTYIAALYGNPPASVGDFTQYVAQNVGITDTSSQVYAADPGFGFKGLKPIFPIWVAVRNIAYTLFAIIFVTVGLMIVLRVRIDPKTVISVQQALPKIIWALVVITFSYPLAGFLIDIMYLTIGFSLNLVQMTGLFKGYSTFVDAIATKGLIDVVGTMSLAANNQLGGLVNGTLQEVLKGAVGVNVGPGSAAAPVVSVVSSLLALYVSLTIAWALISTFISLITSYGTILFNIILAPIILLGEAIPGRSTFTSWLKNIVSNLLVFPAVIMMIAFGNIILDQFKTSGIAVTDTFVPPLVKISQTSIAALIGYIIILTIPKATNLLQELLNVKPTKATEYWKESLIGKDIVQGKSREFTGFVGKILPI